MENVTTKKPDDYVIGTGKTFTIKDFVNRAAKKLNFKIKWVGKGIKEKAINIENKQIIIECRKRYFRPLEVDYLKGNASRAKKILKWSPKISINNLIDEMIQHELKIIMINVNSKVFIAGHNGMLGSSILRILKKKGYKKIITADRKKLDLRNQNSVRKFLKNKNQML